MLPENLQNTKLYTDIIIIQLLNFKNGACSLLMHCNIYLKMLVNKTWINKKINEKSTMPNLLGT